MVNEVSLFLIAFVVVLMVMDTFFGERTHPTLVEISENPEIHDLMRMDESHWPKCLFWHDWLRVPSAFPGHCCWVLTLRACSLSGICLMSLMKMMLLSVCLLNLLFGMMVVITRTKCLVPHHLVPGYMLTFLAGLGLLFCAWATADFPEGGNLGGHSGG